MQPPENEDANEPEAEEEPIEEWSRDQLIQRSKELQLIDENGKCKVPKLDNGTRNCDRVEEIMLSEVEDESKSASRSTTSDSQVRFTQPFRSPFYPFPFVVSDNRKIQSHS